VPKGFTAGVARKTDALDVHTVLRRYVQMGVVSQTERKDEKWEVVLA
jgi:hypothetical protein